MRHTDRQRERATALRRSRVATHSLVLGAAAGSLGVAGALGFSTALHPGTSASSTNLKSSQSGTAPTQGWIIQGDDDGGAGDDGLQWVPLQPSQQFGGTTGGGSAPAPAPHAQSTGS